MILIEIPFLGVFEDSSFTNNSLDCAFYQISISDHAIEIWSVKVSHLTYFSIIFSNKVIRMKTSPLKLVKTFCSKQYMYVKNTSFKILVESYYVLFCSFMI